MQYTSAALRMQFPLCQCGFDLQSQYPLLMFFWSEALPPACKAAFSGFQVKSDGILEMM